jgi:hypothetical protein
MNTKVSTYVELTKPDGRQSKMFSITHRVVLIDDFLKDGSTAERVTEQVSWRGKNGKRTYTELSRIPMRPGDAI